MTASKDGKDEALFGCVVSLAMILAILAGGMGWKWYRAGIQAAIYEGQGIGMSQWEVFVGAEPAEKVIQVREK